MSTTAAHRLKLAAIVTTYFPHSHAQHIVDRFLEGYGWRGRHHRPAMDVVSLYVDRPGENDVSQQRLERFDHLHAYPSPEAALTRGGDRLAVDGVLLIGEHGDYPTDELGRKHYPRHELFQRIVKVFGDSGRCVPVFNDKHLSWDWPKALEMYQTARRMGFALMAGSSLPVAPRMPPLELPLGTPLEEAMCVSYGEIDAYDFHALEAIQCMVERRAGGETGVRWLEARRGPGVWEAMEAGDFSSELLEACLARCDELHLAESAGNHVFPTLEQVRHATHDPIMYRYEHRDGLRCTMLLLNGLVQGWTFAARAAESRDLLSTRLHLRMPAIGQKRGNTLATFFSPLTHHIEQMFLTGQSPTPIERTLLTTGLTAAGVQCLGEDLKRIDTPHLAVTYDAPTESVFAED